MPKTQSKQKQKKVQPKKQTFVINVTQEDIDSGHKGQCETCPIALAAMRVFKTRVLAEGQELHVYHNDIWNLFFLPEEATYFIKAFDHDKPVSPFSFEISK
jgi:hypothetical protein